MKSTYKVNLPKFDDIINNNGLQPGGKTQIFFMNEVIRHATPFVPFKDGGLSLLIIRAKDGTSYEHISPYARVHWYGKVMVGHGLPRKASGKDMNYREAPKRGSKWAERMWVIDGEAITKSVEKYMKQKGG